MHGGLLQWSYALIVQPIILSKLNLPVHHKRDHVHPRDFTNEVPRASLKRGIYSWAQTDMVRSRFGLSPVVFKTEDMIEICPILR